MIKCYWNEKEIGFHPFKYPAGEVSYKIDGVPSKIICWFENSDDILLTKMLQDHFTAADIIFPYLPFGREDRRVADNASFGKESFLRIFFSDCDEISTFDLHSQPKEYFPFTVEEIKPNFILEQVIELINPDVFAFPDTGADSRYRDVNINLNKPCVYGIKERDPQTGEVTSYTLNNSFLLRGDSLENIKILVIDDICDGGKTFIELAKLLPNKELYLYVSHGIFSKGFNELKKYYKHIYTTDSYKGPRDLEFVTEFNLQKEGLI